MTVHIGMVMELKGNGLAEVRTDRQDACGGCHTSHDCRACLSGGGKLLSEVRNPIDAKPGDLVEIDIESRDLLAGAALFYILPIILLALGAFWGASLGTVIGLSETGGAILFCLIGLGIGMVLVRWVSSSRAGMNRLSPRIEKIIERKGE